MPILHRNIVPKYLTTREAARYVSLSPRTLEKFRRTGEGPLFRKLGGRVVYAVEDIDVWAEKSVVGTVSVGRPENQPA
ncbi:helix-turn-helix domain-containing protein [uncultured Bartonella sp.]|uniref:helix-turn-helix domain-containing protein n=1 Tax=uncultured Bartonella sp. TaxID=104108 RepID=UPI0026394B46|nr:helix-turn-helix domain-containing protein [uncultured Bartonella sp.]